MLAHQDDGRGNIPFRGAESRMGEEFAADMPAALKLSTGSIPVPSHDPRKTARPPVPPEEDERAHILVVDDENGPRQSLRMLLKEEFEVHMAENVPAALRLLSEAPIDVIISDIRMPAHSGLDLLEAVRERFPGVGVILLTGYGQLDTAVKAVELGAFAYMEKPFDSAAMVAKVRACVEKRRFEEERQALEYLAVEANRFATVGRLMSGTMHDLGTPLSVIGAHLEILLGSVDHPEIEKRLLTMQSQLHHCNDLVRTSMNFLRQSGASEAPFSLNDVARVCLDVARPLLRRHDIQLQFDQSPTLACSKGDMVLVRQAVLNVIYNACQAMHGQEEPRFLKLRTWNDDQQVYLAVQDSGPGVPEKDRDRIFKTLYSTKGKEGTGLGLAVVRLVMRQHGGDVCLEPHPGRGARFLLTLPCADYSDLR